MADVNVVVEEISVMIDEELDTTSNAVKDRRGELREENATELSVGQVVEFTRHAITYTGEITRLTDKRATIEVLDASGELTLSQLDCVVVGNADAPDDDGY
jgi:hypothetical protein